MNINNNWLFDTISELEQHHLDKSEKEFYDHLNIDRTVTFSGVSFDKDDHEKKFPIFIDSCIFKGERKISEFIILLLLRSSANVEWDYDVTLPLKTDNQDNDKKLHSWVLLNDLIACLYSSTIGRKLRNSLIEWQKEGVEEVYISWYAIADTVVDNSEIEKDSLEKEALLLLQRGLLLIRSIAARKEITCTDSELIKNIADACHNVPYYYQIQDFKNLKHEVMMMKEIINRGSYDNS